MRPAALLLTAACTGRPATAPPARWVGGAVDVVDLPGGGLAALTMSWKSDAPLLVPPRLPGEGTVTVRVSDATGAVVRNTMVADGVLVRPVAIEQVGARVVAAVHQDGGNDPLAEVVVLGLDGAV
jgi:Membrane carboxypeptidase/penicillin-binding protein PbpC